VLEGSSGAGVFDFSTVFYANAYDGHMYLQYMSVDTTAAPAAVIAGDYAAGIS
jgi:hypothetical protein